MGLTMVAVPVHALWPSDERVVSPPQSEHRELTDTDCRVRAWN
jgi:hypothetical protein